VCGHVDWTVGWPEDGGDHTDPGDAYPWDVLFADLAEALGGTTMAFLDDDNAAKLAYRMDALFAGSDTIRGGPEKGQPMEAMKRLNLIEQQVAAGSPVDVPALAAALAPTLAADVAAVLVPSLTSMVEQAVAEVLTKGTDAIQQ
jgi:hypothetical protein